MTLMIMSHHEREAPVTDVMKQGKGLESDKGQYSCKLI